MGMEKSRDPTMQALLEEPSGQAPQDLPPTAPVKLYSTTQVGVGTFLCGPLAAMFYLRHNFNALERRNMAQKVVAGSLLYTFVLAVVIYFLPEDFPSSVIPAVNLAVVLSIMHSNGMKKEDLLAAGHGVQHWGRALAVGLGGFLLFLAILLGVLISMDQILGVAG